MVIIFITIDPAELQPLREFGSEADFVPPLRGKVLRGSFPFFRTCQVLTTSEIVPYANQEVKNSPKNYTNFR